MLLLLLLLRIAEHPKAVFCVLEGPVSTQSCSSHSGDSNPADKKDKYQYTLESIQTVCGP